MKVSTPDNAMLLIFSGHLFVYVGGVGRSEAVFWIGVLILCVGISLAGWITFGGAK